MNRKCGLFVVSNEVPSSMVGRQGRNNYRNGVVAKAWGGEGGCGGCVNRCVWVDESVRHSTNV